MLSTQEKNHIDLLVKLSSSNSAFLQRISTPLLNKIIKIKFPKEWKVEKLNNNNRAVVRYMVNDRFSIFFDAVGEMVLGTLQWEFYDNQDEEIWRFDLGDEYDMIDEIQEIMEGYNE